jgi:hypothetical protein
MIAFGLSSCSFWPFAHISAINLKEEAIPTKDKTFDTNFALSILALSLPISVLLILGIFTAGNTFASINNILILCGCLFLIGILHPIFTKIKKRFVSGKNNSSKIKKSDVQFLRDK